MDAQQIGFVDDAAKRLEEWIERHEEDMEKTRFVRHPGNIPHYDEPEEIRVSPWSAEFNLLRGLVGIVVGALKEYQRECAAADPEESERERRDRDRD